MLDFWLSDIITEDNWILRSSWPYGAGPRAAIIMWLADREPCSPGVGVYTVNVVSSLAKTVFSPVLDFVTGKKRTLQFVYLYHSKPDHVLAGDGGLLVGCRSFSPGGLCAKCTNILVADGRYRLGRACLCVFNAEKAKAGATSGK